MDVGIDEALQPRREICHYDGKNTKAFFHKALPTRHCMLLTCLIPFA